VLFTTVAPFHDLHLGRDVSFQLAPDTYLAPIPDWLKSDQSTLSRLSQRDQEGFATCTHCFLSEYEVDEAAELLASRRENATYRSPKGAKLDEIYLANLALWLMRLSSVGFSLVFHAIANRVQEPWHHDRFLYHPNDGVHSSQPTLRDLDTMKTLFTAMCRVPRHSALWTAFRAVTSALQMQRNEIRHLLLWIALEALFGTTDGEVKYRLSQRLAFFLAKDRNEAFQLFVKAKQGYDARSKIAHGAWGSKTLNSKQSVALTGTTEEFVRRSFVRLLQDGATTEKFSGSGNGRSAYLDRLPFEESRRGADLLTQSGS
jgi:Apea-like HEPN